MISLERRDGRPLRIGHRGAAALAPENTLRSFRAAVEAGVDLVEFDVLELRDRALVIAHSNDLAEVSHGAAKGSVRERPLESLRKVCPELPTLDEALAFFAHEVPHIGLHLDLKTRGTEAEVAAALGRFDLLDRSFVSSFHFSTVRKLARIAPRIRVGITLPRSVLGVTESGRGAPIARSALWLLRRVAPVAAPLALPASRATALVLHHSLIGDSVVRRAHDRDAAVIAWTVDDPRDLARVETAGVDAIVTNDPRIFTSTLET
ncbi:MAG: glycerophosphodiester phosphodiesterase [Gaiellaceae bacterium]